VALPSQFFCRSIFSADSASINRAARSLVVVVVVVSLIRRHQPPFYLKIIIRCENERLMTGDYPACAGWRSHQTHS
jgi:hypothetical protein